METGGLFMRISYTYTALLIRKYFFRIRVRGSVNMNYWSESSIFTAFAFKKIIDTSLTLVFINRCMHV
jgi:hypothetical protein